MADPHKLVNESGTNTTTSVVVLPHLRFEFWLPAKSDRILVKVPAMILSYFDPGAGSLLLQLLVGGAGGILVLGKYLWNHLLSR